MKKFAVWYIKSIQNGTENACTTVKANNKTEAKQYFFLHQPKDYIDLINIEKLKDQNDK